MSGGLGRVVSVVWVRAGWGVLLFFCGGWLLVVIRLRGVRLCCVLPVDVRVDGDDTEGCVRVGIAWSPRVVGACVVLAVVCSLRVQLFSVCRGVHCCSCSCTRWYPMYVD